MFNYQMGTPTGEFKGALEEAKKRPGRPPGPSSVTRRNVYAAQKLFQSHAQEALETMVGIMRDVEVDPAIRLKASNDILNRAYGTPVSVQVQEKIITDERQSPISTGAISTAATAELEQLAAVLARFIESERATIDVTPVMPDNYPDE
jgi:hypothetical protein